MTNQLTNALMQPAHHLSHRQHQLDRRISIRSHLFQPLHGSQRFDLIRFLHSDSPFFRQRKIALSLSKGQSLRVATFYDLPGIPVSLTHDRDRRSAYLLLDDSTPTIRRVDYDLERELKVLSVCTLPHADWVAKIL